MLFHGTEQVIHPDARSLFQTAERPAAFARRHCPDLPAGGERSRVVPLSTPQGRFFLKIYRYTGLWKLRTFGIVSRAKREFHNLLRLSKIGFRTAQPLAFGQERRFGLVGTSYLLTRAIDNAIDLRELTDHPDRIPFPAPDPAHRRVLIETFARTLRRSHDQGFYIHTLFLKNLLLTRQNGGYELHLIDVPFAGIFRHRLFPGIARVRDLACLLKGARTLLSPRERIRFVRAYGASRSLLRSVQIYQERYYP